MNRLLVLLAGLALAGAAAAATPQAGSAGDAGWHWWLHPKLGMVKVDRVTHGIIVSGKPARTASTAAR